MATISSVAGRMIRDSRGQPTVEVTVSSDTGLMATASLPIGTSISSYEAPIADAATAVNTINTVIAPALLRQSADQASVDALLRQFYDASPQMGTNSLLGISVACSRLNAEAQGVPLYVALQQMSGSAGYTLPTPMFNLINGGKHAQNNLDFQEYLIIPLGFSSFHEKLSAGRAVFRALGHILAEAGHDTRIGSEGGFAPDLSTNEEGLGMLSQAITAAGFVPGQDIFMGLDVAASSLDATYQPNVDAYIDLFEDFPLFSIEDPFIEDDWNNWSSLKQSLDAMQGTGQPRLLVGDDLFVGNQARLEEGIKRYVANSILVKMSQFPTLSDIVQTIRTANQNNYVHILSHRSGDTLDSFISDLAVGSASAFIKAGAPNDSAPERMTKYERIVQIEEELYAQR